VKGSGTVSASSVRAPHLLAPFSDTGEAAQPRPVSVQNQRKVRARLARALFMLLIFSLLSLTRAGGAVPRNAIDSAVAASYGASRTWNLLTPMLAYGRRTKPR